MQVFEIPSAPGGALTWILLLPLVLVAALALVFWPRPLRVEVTASELTVRGSIYGRALKRSDLDLDHARALDLRETPEFTPRSRTNGVGLPNYQVGWFRLGNGKRALCFITRREPLLYLPTRQGYVLLLSVTDPGAVLSALRAQ